MTSAAFQAAGSGDESFSDTPTDDHLAALVSRACAGSPEAWRELVDLYGRRVYALARSRCRDSEMAEEVTQSVFVTVAEKLPGAGYDERGRFEAWLFRVAMNRVRDELRRRRRQRDGKERLRLVRGDEAAERSAAQEKASEFGSAEIGALREAMARLADRDREIIELRHHAAMSFKQIADLTGEPMGTVLARHHRALRKLKGMIESGAGPKEASE